MLQGKDKEHVSYTCEEETRYKITQQIEILATPEWLTNISYSKWITFFYGWYSFRVIFFYKIRMTCTLDKIVIKICGKVKRTAKSLLVLFIEYFYFRKAFLFQVPSYKLVYYNLSHRKNSSYLQSHF